MCAIAGVINYQNYDLIKFRNSLLHRGPDEQNIYSFKNIALIHNRLSIQDILDGQQPFHFKGYSIILNGEIYNHLELRELLKEFEFKTKSDTETLLYLYIKYREDMFELIDGMFAFAILDKKTNQLILAKDRAGKKPLFLYKKDDKFIFASELNAIKAIEKLEINEESIASYLRVGMFLGENSSYKNITKFPAGHYAKVDLNQLNIEYFKYFDILDSYKKQKNIDEMSKKEALNSVDTALRKSIKDRIDSSDLEVGAFLSGGIDSALVVSIASEFKKNLKTFTVKFDSGYDESPLAKLVADKYKTQHCEIDISLNLKEDIEDILLNYGEPFYDSSAIPSYYVAKEAKKHITVVLNGDGADELFAGYRRYVPIANNLTNIAKNFSFLTKYLPKPHQKKSLYNHFFRLLSMSDKKGVDFYLSSTVDIFEDIYNFKENRVIDELDSFITKVDDEKISNLSKMLYLDFSNILFSDLLIKMDIATMQHSLEARSPFLSKYMLEIAPILPDEYKINRTSTKYVLRELSKKYLPNELINQPKRGFEVPLKSWVEGELKEHIDSYLTKDSYSENFIDRAFIQKLLNNKIEISSEKRAKILWNLFSLELWHRRQ